MAADAQAARTSASAARAKRGRAAGRRPGESGTREAILEAARAAFAEAGYDRATIRGIAAAAGVDPALVLHYFGSKEGLFGAALELPVRPAEVFARGAAAGPDQLGATVVRTFLEAWEPPETRVRLLAMLRSAMTNETAMGMIRELLVREVFGPITQTLGVPDAPAARDARRLAVRRPRDHALHRPCRAARLGLGRRPRRSRGADRAAVPDGGRGFGPAVLPGRLTDHRQAARPRTSDLRG